MSKKFRKFAAPELNKTTIHAEIEARVAANEPIVFNFPFGGYKLWRLEESPEADWGEIFSIIYYARWLKPICNIYAPGVRFVFRIDEVVVEKLNNIPVSETETYRKSFERVLEFVKAYIPENLVFEVFLERSRYGSYEDFEKELQVEIDALRAQRAQSPQPLSEGERKSIELNVRLRPGQESEPNWQEENDLIHIAYYTLQENKVHPRKHYMNEGIVAFPFLFDTPNLVAVGTTKASVAKFWVGVGALKRKKDEYLEVVLSPGQLAKSSFIWEPMGLPGLEGKSFSKIRILD